MLRFVGTSLSAFNCKKLEDSFKFSVSPPTEHAYRWGLWYDKYQPVSYIIENGLGTRAEFSSMVDRCEKVGVLIIGTVYLRILDLTNINLLNFIGRKLSFNQSAHEQSYHHLGMGDKRAPADK